MQVTPDKQQTMTAGGIYSEDRSALRWPYLALLVLWLLLFALGAALMTAWANPVAALMMAVGILGFCSTATLAALVWPVGIRIDDDGIRIGGVRRTRRPDRALPWADHQRSEVLRVPWQAVRRAAVVTDKPSIREAGDLRKGAAIKLGVLWSPFARSVLLVEVDPDRVVLPKFREQDIDRPFWRPAHRAPVHLSPVWYVPTRRPDALRTVLAQHAVAVGGQADPSLPAHLRRLFERADSAV